MVYLEKDRRATYITTVAIVIICFLPDIVTHYWYDYQFLGHMTH